MADSNDNDYIKARDAAITLSTDMHKTSAQEYDKQIVYIAGGALALTLTFAKDIVTVTGSHFILLLILAWIAFAASLLCNLISHRKATEVYSLTRTLHLYLRDCAQPQPITIYEVVKRQKIDADLSKANKWLTGLNRASEWTIVVGIGAFIVFSALNAYLTATKLTAASETNEQAIKTDDKLAGNTHNTAAYDSTKLKNASNPSATNSNRRELNFSDHHKSG